MTVPSVPVESGDTTSYREQVASIVDTLGDYPYQAADDILAVRDAEMERLRAEQAVAHEAACTIPGYQRDIERLRAEYAKALQEWTDQGMRAAVENERLRSEVKMHTEIYMQVSGLLDDIIGADEGNGAGEGLVADVALAIERLKAALVFQRGTIIDRTHERDEARAELADLRERAVILPLNWRTTIRSLPSNYSPSHWGADEERWAYKEALRDVTEGVSMRHVCR